MTKLKVGDGTEAGITTGPLINKAAIAKVQEHIDDAVKKGAKVNRGDIIGRMGATGRATGTHLHYEVLANGRLLNPLQLLTQQKPRDR